MSLVLPPASPGYRTYPNSGIIAIAAGAFPGPTRGSLSVITDPTAPGPTQIQDSQSAVSNAAALDSVVIDMDTVGVVTGRKYGIFLGYLANDAGALQGRMCTVLNSGTILQSDDTPGTGQVLVVSGGPYGLELGCDFQMIPPGFVLKTGAGQQIKFRVWHQSGSGSVNLDCIFLIPVGTGGNPLSCNVSQNVMWEAVIDPSPYTWPVQDGWQAPGSGFGWNGLFPCMDERGYCVESTVTAQPDPSNINNILNWNGGCGGITGTIAPQRQVVTARCVNPGLGAGKVTAVLGNYPAQAAGHTYDVPDDGSVYLIDLDLDPLDPFDPSGYWGIMLWAPSGQLVRSSEAFVLEVDPPPSAPVGPTLEGEYRIS